MSKRKSLYYSIQQLENDCWRDLEQYPTPLVKRCHELRKKKIKDLKINDIKTLLIQDIGSDYLLPIVIDRMESNFFEEDEETGTSFWKGSHYFNEEIFNRNPDFLKKIIELFEINRAKIKDQMELKVFERELTKINNLIS